MGLIHVPEMAELAALLPLLAVFARRRGRRMNRRGIGGQHAGFSYSDPGGLILDLSASRGITLGGTLLASGPTPPAVTITGTLTQALGIQIDIQTGGARGTATFRWSINNGATWVEQNIVTAATYALGSTGITANFAVGTYDADNLYKSTVAALANQVVGLAHDFAEATPGNQPQMESGGWNSQPSLLFDGSNDRLTCSSSLAQDLFGGTDNDWSLFMVAQLTANGGNDALWGAGINGAAAAYQYCQQRTTGTFLNDRQGTAGAQTDPGIADTDRHVFEWVYSGTALVQRIDGVEVENAALDSATDMVMDRMVLAAIWFSSASDFGPLRFRRMLGYTGALSDGNAALVRAALTSEHGL